MTSPTAAPERADRHFGQKVSLVFAVLCAVAAVATAVLAVWLLRTRGLADFWVPSAFASVAFFGCVAGVCYVMSRPKQALLPWDADDAPPASKP